MSKTIDYYDSNADSFYDNTVNADMNMQYQFFTKYLQPEARILDCGCGSGRDTKYFLEQGYKVTAIDGSEKLCKKATELTGIAVHHVLFQDIDYEDQFDGIWACASLLHLGEDELQEVFGKLASSLTENGILYASFKYGDYSGDRNGRMFTDMTEETAEKLVQSISNLSIMETYISADVRPGRADEKWLNMIIKKV